MNTIKDIEDKFFNLGDYSDISIRQFLDKTKRDRSVASGGFASTTSPPPVFDESDAFKYLSDRGDGRIYQGLQSLEFMSRVLNGTPASSLSLFDGKLLAYKPDDLKYANTATGRLIILTNLGVEGYWDVVKALEHDDVAKFFLFMDKLVRQIKSGGFRAADSFNEAALRTKAIVKLALNQH